MCLTFQAAAAVVKTSNAAQQTGAAPRLQGKQPLVAKYGSVFFFFMGPPCDCDNNSDGVRATHAGVGLGDEEELGEGSVQRQQHGDAGGILVQAAFHRHEELPQRPQQRHLAGSAEQTQQQ